MIFVLDNYDSFTYNLVHLLYALERDIVVKRNREVTADEVLAMYPEAIILSPGPGRPAAAGIMPDPLFLCLPTVESPGIALPFDGKPFTLAPYGVGAVCSGKLNFAEYEKPYPALPEICRKHLAKVEGQRLDRAGHGSAPEWLVRLSIPDLPIPYELSMTVDLYDNRYMLCEETPEGIRELGFLGRSGFRREMTPKDDMVVNGTESVWIPLREIVGSGEHKLLLRSLHRGNMYYVNSPFYSFVVLEIAREAGKPEYRIEFMNELEPDRSELRFNLFFQE